MPLLHKNPMIEFAEAADSAWFDGDLASVRRVAADVTAPLQARLDALEDLSLIHISEPTRPY